MKEITGEFLKYYFTNPFILFFLIIGLLSLIFYKKIVGWFGEFWTKQALNKLPKDDYKVINNVFISSNIGTHQIDHVIVSKYGIFSIETKQYSGYIVGSKYDSNWIRYSGNKRYYYSNPIRQNYGHVKALSELLKIDETKIHNIVCIPSNARLKIEHDGELVRYDTIVSKILSYKKEVLSNIDELSNIIKSKNIKDINIKNALNKCPKCGSQLIQKNGKYGSFVGCSNYPKCKYIQK